MDEFAGSQVDVRDLGLALCQKALQAALADSDHAYIGHIALQKSVCRLSGAVSDEDYLIRTDIAGRQALFKGFHNSSGHTSFA